MFLKNLKPEVSSILWCRRPGVNFINILCAAFTHVDPESKRFQLSRQYQFTLLRSSAREKASWKTLMKLTPGLQQGLLRLRTSPGISFQPTSSVCFPQVQRSIRKWSKTFLEPLNIEKIYRLVQLKLCCIIRKTLEFFFLFCCFNNNEIS